MRKLFLAFTLVFAFGLVINANTSEIYVESDNEYFADCFDEAIQVVDDHEAVYGPVTMEEGAYMMNVAIAICWAHGGDI